MPRLLLASTSPYRRAQLERLGVSFEVARPECDERAFFSRGGDPRDLAAALARAKAESVRARHPEHHILGGDQLVAFEGAILGKPGSSREAEAQLARLSGKTHELVSAVALVTPSGVVKEHVHVHVMWMRSLEAAAIRRYVARDQPIDCCGSYKIERGGIALFASIVGEDFSAIEGMPLIGLTEILSSEGFTIP